MGRFGFGFGFGGSSGSSWTSRYFILSSGPIRYRREINRAGGYFKLDYSEDSGVTWENLETLDLTENLPVIDLSHIYHHRIVDYEYRVDNFLTPLGYAGIEGVDWENLYTADGFWTEEYVTVLAAMDTPPSSNDQFNQNIWLKKMIKGGYHAKAELLDMFSTDTSANGLFNWKDPTGTHNPSFVGVLEHQKYAGFRGIDFNSRYLDLNFIPSSDGTLIGQNNICLMIAEGDNIFGDQDEVGGNAADNKNLQIRGKHNNGNAYFRNNSADAISVANINTIKYYASSRNAAGNFDRYINKTKINVNANSVGLPTVDLCACGVNNNGTKYGSYKQVRFVFLFSYLTEAEIDDIINITEEYLSNYKTNVINYDNYIAKPYNATKAVVALTTYDGSGQTCHPSVVNIGSAWNGYQYWMANTPFPNNAALENPSIWASSDGETFVVPAGLTNPIIAKPADGNNSDTHLFYNSDDNKLYIIWRVNGVIGWKMKMSSTSDGITWSVPVIVLSPIAGETSDLSPSLIKIGGLFYIYFYTYDTVYTTMVAKRVSCNTIDGTYGNRETVNLPVMETGEYWWHFDIKYINGTYWMPAVLFGSSMSRIYLLKSADAINFIGSPYPVVWPFDTAYENSGLYRPCLEVIAGQPTIYYGTVKDLTTFGLAKIDVDLL